MSRKPDPDLADPVNAADAPGSASRIRSLSGPLVVALICGSVLMLTHLLTAQRISHNESLQAQKQLRQLLANALPAQQLDAVIWNTNTRELCVADTLVLRRQTSGYAGAIELLLAIRLQQPPVLAAVNVARHLETPGIADFLTDTGPQSWLAQLQNRAADSLSAVDTVTGATISSNAVLRGAAQALREAGEHSECAP